MANNLISRHFPARLHERAKRPAPETAEPASVTRSGVYRLTQVKRLIFNNVTVTALGFVLGFVIRKIVTGDATMSKIKNRKAFHPRDAGLKNWSFSQMITDNSSRVFAADQQHKPGVGRSWTFSGAAAIAAFLIVSILDDVPRASAEPTFKNVPFAIVCVREGTAGFGYLSQFNKDGSAIYISMDGRRAMKLTAEGTTEKVPGMAFGSECVGKKLEDLRAEGLAIDFPK